MASKRTEITLWSLLFVIIIVQTALWRETRPIQAQWLNVPPVPTERALTASFLGDEQLAYRVSSLMLQNLGDEGGRITPLSDYNYADLKQWFFLMDKLDAKSDYIPYIAAYYYGGLDDQPEKIKEIVAYLEHAGNSVTGEKWRWLARAVFLARYKMQDLDYALLLAKKLAALSYQTKASEMPNWTRQMPAFILNAKGEKEAAYAIMLEILKSVGDKIHPAEFNHTLAYICETILSPSEAMENELCKDVK